MLKESFACALELKSLLLQAQVSTHIGQIVLQSWPQAWQRIAVFSELTTNSVGRLIVTHDLDVEPSLDGDSGTAVNGKARIAQGRPGPIVLPTSYVTDQKTSQDRRSPDPK